ncbi:MAG: phage Gp37/Gp68 family protein [Terracidiphilus sp.]
MGAKTGIEWTDSTWNPFIGCSRVSEGCRHCYAERLAGRFSAKTDGVYAGTTKAVNGLQVWTGKINRAPEETLLKPLHWRPLVEGCRGLEKSGVLHDPRLVCRDCVKRPRRIFVNSMSDLFHENVPDTWIDQIFAVMALCPQHVFQVLTKRPERMLAYFAHDGGFGRWGYIEGCARKIAAELKAPKPPAGTTLAIWGGRNLPNVWLGVSVENQAAADERIPLLLRTPAAVRFISAEPLLGPVDLEELPSASGIGRYLDSLSNAGVDKGALIPNKLDWVIAGGESGPGARPMNPDWARSLRDQCVDAAVPFFFKQWGEYSPKNRREDLPAHPTMVCEAKGDVLLTIEGKIETFDSCGGVGDHAVMERIGKKAAGALLDGREWKQFPACRAETQCRREV